MKIQPTPQFNIETLKKLLPQLTNQNLEQIKNIARTMGLSEQQINDGVKQLNQLRN